MTGIRVTGDVEALKNLNREIRSIKGDISKGLKAAVTYIQGKAVEITPAKTGVLRGSAFNDVSDQSARVGYTAKYAPFVHEMPETNNFSTPDTGPKFLTKAIFNNTRTILEIIRKRASR